MRGRQRHCAIRYCDHVHRRTLLPTRMRLLEANRNQHAVGIANQDQSSAVLLDADSDISAVGTRPRTPFAGYGRRRGKRKRQSASKPFQHDRCLPPAKLTLRVGRSRTHSWLEHPPQFGSKNSDDEGCHDAKAATTPSRPSYRGACSLHTLTEAKRAEAGMDDDDYRCCSPKRSMPEKPLSVRRRPPQRGNPSPSRRWRK